MRKSVAVLLFAALMLAGSGQAQDKKISVFNGGMRPQTVTMRPRDTTQFMTPPQMTRYPQFGPQKTVSATKFFPKLALGSWPPRLTTPSPTSVKNNPVQVTTPKVGNPLMPQN
jgi:hypothetical protein